LRVPRKLEPATFVRRTIEKQRFAWWRRNEGFQALEVGSL
jgi:hypothetical protein